MYLGNLTGSRLHIQGLGGFGCCGVPLAGTTEQRPPEESGIIDEIQRLGRVKMTCIIRDLNTKAYGYVTLKQAATEKGQQDLVTYFDERRERIRTFIDYIYGVIDTYFGGEWGREAAIGSKECEGKGLGNLGGLPLVIIVAAIVVTGGVLAYALKLAADYATDTKTYAQALDFCATTDSAEKCKAALDTQVLNTQTREEGGLLKNLGQAVQYGVIAVGVVFAGLVGFKVLGHVMASRRLVAATGTAGTSGLCGCGHRRVR